MVEITVGPSVVKNRGQLASFLASYWPKWEQFQLPSFKSTRVWSHRALFVLKAEADPSNPSFILATATVHLSHTVILSFSFSLSPSLFLASLVQAWNWLNHQWACEKKDWPGLKTSRETCGREKRTFSAQLKPNVTWTATGLSIHSACFFVIQLPTAWHEARRKIESSHSQQQVKRDSSQQGHFNH